MHRRFNRLVFLFAATLAATCASVLPASAAESVGSTTSRAARDEAIRAIPFAKIDPEYRGRIQSVLRDISLYRRLPTMTVECHPSMFTYHAQNPDVLVQIWRQLGISNIDLVQKGNNEFHMADNVGTVGELVIVEQRCDAKAQNRFVLYAEGQYDGKPFKKPLRAECVMLLRSGSVVETNGHTYVAAQLDTFVHIDRASLELFAQVIHPLVGKTADRNFADTMNFISSMSQAAETRPATIARLTGSLPKISTERKQRLVQIAYQCAESRSGPEESGERLARRSD